VNAIGRQNPLAQVEPGLPTARITGGRTLHSPCAIGKRPIASILPALMAGEAVGYRAEAIREASCPGPSTTTTVPILTRL
jgi:hypothetical protein